MITLTKIFEFEASHSLPLYKGACHNLHGHSYKLEVTVTGKVDLDVSHTKCGMIMDFKDLNNLVKSNIISKLDHAHLNTLFSNPTAEIMVNFIADTLNEILPKGVKLVSVKLWETSTSYAEYRA